MWHDEDGVLHREDGPAVEMELGGKQWFTHGELRREDGPVVEYWGIEARLAPDPTGDGERVPLLATWSGKKIPGHALQSSDRDLPAIIELEFAGF